MTNFTVLLADDDPQQLGYLQALVQVLRPDWTVVAALTDIDAVPEAISSFSPSLCILDVRFAETTGIEVMRTLRSSQPVIYVTGEAAFAVQAFDSAAVDFVVKPIQRQRFEQALEKAERQITQGVERPFPPAAASTGSTMVRMLRGHDLTIVPLEDVRFFQAERKYTRVVLAGQEGYLRMGLSSIERHVNPEQFWRVHRGYIVNAKHIALAKKDELGRLFLKLQDRTDNVPVSKPYESLFKDGFF
jgi:DNA-binding LytR/AlgR family response regulator